MKAKAKPRLAVYLGAAGSALAAAGVTVGTNVVPYNALSDPKHVTAAVYNVAAIASKPMTSGVIVATPLVVGGIASWVADKIGFNKILAKGKLPFRI